jgi:hypothetical protein
MSVNISDIFVHLNADLWRWISVKFLAICFMLVPCLAYSLAMMVEVICSSETSADFRRTTQHYNSQDRKNPSGRGGEMNASKHFQNVICS